MKDKKVEVEEPISSTSEVGHDSSTTSPTEKEMERLDDNYIAQIVHMELIRTLREDEITKLKGKIEKLRDEFRAYVEDTNSSKANIFQKIEDLTQIVDSVDDG